MKMVVLDGFTLNPGDNPWRELEALGELSVYDRTRGEEVVERAEPAGIVLTNKTPITREHIARLSRLAYVSILATGYTVVDIAAARERGIPVSNVPSYGSATVAQHVMALILAQTNGVADYARSVASGDWERSPDFCYYRQPIRELSGLTLGIVGYGQIGQSVARLARAFGMKVVYASRAAKVTNVEATHVTLERLFSESDIVSLHCNQTAANARFVNKALLVTMKPHALLINTARGTLVDEADLAWALREGRIAGAALDVLASEPPNPANSLLRLPNCIVTPHVAWSSLAARQRLMTATVENVRAFLAGTPRNVVN